MMSLRSQSRRPACETVAFFYGGTVGTSSVVVVEQNYTLRARTSSFQNARPLARREPFGVGAYLLPMAEADTYPPWGVPVTRMEMLLAAMGVVSPGRRTHTTTV